MPSTESQVLVRPATLDDASAIVAIWETVVAERKYTAVDAPFTWEEERAYLSSLSGREIIHVAEVAGQVVGFQSLDGWVKYTHSMDHVGQMGTFILPAFRGRGIGHRLTQATLDFARRHGYEKIVIFIRQGNAEAQAFYASLGFVPCGKLSRQVKIDGKYDDEIFMELFL